MVYAVKPDWIPPFVKFFPCYSACNCNLFPLINGGVLPIHWYRYNITFGDISANNTSAIFKKIAQSDCISLIKSHWDLLDLNPSSQKNGGATVCLRIFIHNANHNEMLLSYSDAFMRKCFVKCPLSLIFKFLFKHVSYGLFLLCLLLTCCLSVVISVTWIQGMMVTCSPHQMLCSVFSHMLFLRLSEHRMKKG